MNLPDLRPALPEMLDPTSAVPPFTRLNWRYTDRCPICKLNRKTRRMSSCQKCIDNNLYQDKFDNIDRLRHVYQKQKTIHSGTKESLQTILDENEARLAIVREKYSKEESELQKLGYALDKEEQNIILQVNVLSNDIRLYHSTNTNFELETHCTIVRPPNIHKDIYFGHVTLIIADSNSELRWHYGIKTVNGLPDNLNNVFWSTPSTLSKSNNTLIEKYGDFGYPKGTTLEKIMLNHFGDCFSVFDKTQWTKQIWNRDEIQQESREYKILNRLKKLEQDRKLSDKQKVIIQNQEEEEELRRVRLEKQEELRRIRQEQVEEAERNRLEEENEEKIIRHERIKKRDEENLRQQKDKKDKEDDEEIEKAIELANIERADIKRQKDAKEIADKEIADIQREKVREILLNLQNGTNEMKKEIQQMIDEDIRISSLDQNNHETHAARESLISEYEQHKETFNKYIENMSRVQDVRPELITQIINKLLTIYSFEKTDERIKILKLENELYKNRKNTNKDESDDTLINILMKEICTNCSLQSAHSLVQSFREKNPDGISIEKFLLLFRNHINIEDTIKKKINSINKLIPYANHLEIELIKEGQDAVKLKEYRELLITGYNFYVPDIKEIEEKWQTFELSEETNKKIKEFLQSSEAMDWEKRLSKLTSPPPPPPDDD